MSSPSGKAAAVALVLLAVTLTGCGESKSAGASKDSAQVVARVGSSPISRAAVGHWMSALAGGDYFELSRHHKVPGGLVSDPPDYRRCVVSLEAAAASSPSSAPKPPGVQLLGKCQALYRALKLQATAFLVRGQWLIGLAREQGISPSDGEVKRFFKRSEGERFPKQSELRQYLTDRRSTLADELFVVKLDLLAQKLQQKLAAGKQAQDSKLLQSRIAQAEASWDAKTSCSPGYVVEHCKQYTGQASLPESSSPAVLLEQVAALVTGRCTNLAACAKQ
jgi:hypothetical protein